MRRITMILLIFLFFSSLITCQAFQVERFSKILQGKYPVPEWIKPGLVAVYKMSGGMRTIGGGDTSASYGEGYMVSIVTNVEKNVVYGLTVTIFTYPNFMVFPPNPTVLFLHVDPRQMRETLAMRDELANQGIIVNGGENQDGMWLSISYGMANYTFFTTEDGQVRRFSFLEKQQGGSSTTDAVLMMTFQTDFPSVREFPKVARENHSYNIYSYDPYYTGIKALEGRETMEFERMEGMIAIYRLGYYTMGMGFPIPKEAIGLPCLGPHYIHPDLLRREILLNVRSIGFTWMNEVGEAGIDSVMYINDQEMMRITCDENGLVTGISMMTPSSVVIMELEE